MDVENFAEWMRRRGHKVYRTASSYWHSAGPRVLQAFPYHWLIRPTEDELRRLMLNHGIVGLRYSTPPDASEGMASYHVELRRPYTLEGLNAKARNGVKKGLANFHVERIPFERLAEDGWQLQYETLERQNRLSSMSQETWRKICLSTAGLDGFEAWAAIAGEQLAGSLVTARIDNVICVPFASSRSCFLREHVNNILFFETSYEILKDETIDHIFFTVQSLDAPESVDDFKFRMGLSPVPVRQRVVFHPLLAPLVTRPGHALVRWLVNRYPGSDPLAKMEGMLRFHLLGRRPLAEQVWPDCLSHITPQDYYPSERKGETHTPARTPVGLQTER